MAQPANNNITKAFKDAFKRAGGGFFVGEVEGYCENTLCETRYVRMTVKGDTSEWTGVDVLHCPMCTEPLKLHGVTTFEEEGKHHRSIARYSVNAQLYGEIKINQSSAVPLSVMADALPPICEHVRDYINGLAGEKE